MNNKFYTLINYIAYHSRRTADFRKILLPLVVVLFSFFSPMVHANRCDLNYVFLMNPKLLEDEKFLNALNKLVISNKGSITDEQMLKLQKQYGYSLAETATASTVAKSGSGSSSGTIGVSKAGGGLVPHFNRGVERAVKKLEPYLIKKYDDAMAILKQGKDGLKKLRETPGSWNLEKILLDGQSVYSMRLNQGNRLVFTLEDNDLQIIGVGNQVYRH